MVAMHDFKHQAWVRLLDVGDRACIKRGPYAGLCGTVTYRSSDASGPFKFGIVLDGLSVDLTFKPDILCEEEV